MLVAGEKLIISKYTDNTADCVKKQQKAYCKKHMERLSNIIYRYKNINNDNDVVERIEYIKNKYNMIDLLISCT